MSFGFPNGFKGFTSTPAIETHRADGTSPERDFVITPGEEMFKSQIKPKVPSPAASSLSSLSSLQRATPAPMGPSMPAFERAPLPDAVPMMSAKAKASAKALVRPTPIKTSLHSLMSSLAISSNSETGPDQESFDVAPSSRSANPSSRALQGLGSRIMKSPSNDASGPQKRTDSAKAQVFGSLNSSPSAGASSPQKWAVKPPVKTAADYSFEQDSLAQLSSQFGGPSAAPNFSQVKEKSKRLGSHRPQSAASSQQSSLAASGSQIASLAPSSRLRTVSPVVIHQKQKLEPSSRARSAMVSPAPSSPGFSLSAAGPQTQSSPGFSFSAAGPQSGNNSPMDTSALNLPSQTHQEYSPDSGKSSPLSASSSSSLESASNRLEPGLLPVRQFSLSAMPPFARQNPNSGSLPGPRPATAPVRRAQVAPPKPQRMPTKANDALLAQLDSLAPLPSQAAAGKPAELDSLSMLSSQAAAKKKDDSGRSMMQDDSQDNGATAAAEPNSAGDKKKRKAKEDLTQISNELPSGNTGTVFNFLVASPRAKKPRATGAFDLKAAAKS